MTRIEFAPIMAYLATACGASAPTREQAEVYFDLLGDLPAQLVQSAAKQVAMEHNYPNLPPVGLIRKAAIALREPTTPGPKAWEMFCKAVSRYGSGRQRLWANGRFHEIDNEQLGLASLPPDVARAARAFGWNTLCDTTREDMGIAQTQFLKVYAQLGAHEQREAIMPPDVRALANELAGGFGLNGKPVLKLAEHY